MKNLISMGTLAQPSGVGQCNTSTCIQLRRMRTEVCMRATEPSPLSAVGTGKYLLPVPPPN